MGSEIAAVPDTLCTDISNDLAKISKRMMDLAAQLRALAAQSAEQTMSLGAAKRSYRYAVTALRPRKLIFKRSLVAALRHCSSQTVSSRVPFQQLGERRGLLLHPPATMTMAQFPEAESAGGLETRGVNAALSKFGTFLSRQGAGPLYMKPMLHCDKLYEICASDLDKGGNANGPEEQQGVEEFSVLDEGDPVSHHVDKVALQPHGNENPTAPKGRKRVFADVDNLETSLCNVPNSFAKFLEAEKENGMQMAMMNTVQT
uniref:Uncharacterized protein n=1 Tax=Oryza meridionalis TaxID=40149 RepID=A0A0E0E0P1_9ORYZ